MSKQLLKLSEETHQALFSLNLGRTSAPAASFRPDPIVIAPQKPLPVVAPR